MLTISSWSNQSIKVTDSDFDANPPLEEKNWRKVLKSFGRNCERAEKNPIIVVIISKALLSLGDHYSDGDLLPILSLTQLCWCDDLFE